MILHAKEVVNSSCNKEGAAGAAVQVLSAADGMTEVRFLGREDTGYMAESSLIPGSEQAFRYDAWCEDGFLYGVRDIIICADDPGVTWYASAHDENNAEPSRWSRWNMCICRAGVPKNAAV